MAFFRGPSVVGEIPIPIPIPIPIQEGTYGSRCAVPYLVVILHRMVFIVGFTINGKF